MDSACQSTGCAPQTASPPTWKTPEVHSETDREKPCTPKFRRTDSSPTPGTSSSSAPVLAPLKSNPRASGTTNCPIASTRPAPRLPYRIAAGPKSSWHNPSPDRSCSSSPPRCPSSSQTSRSTRPNRDPKASCCKASASRCPTASKPSQSLAPAPTSCLAGALSERSPAECSN